MRLLCPVGVTTSYDFSLYMGRLEPISMLRYNHLLKVTSSELKLAGKNNYLTLTIL
jgi:hypothetical protein